MRSFPTKTVLLAAALLFVSGGVARASTFDIKVPFQFVVNGRTMPAGQYRVNDDNQVVQLNGERGNQANMFALTTPAAGHDPKGESPALTFYRYENQYRLADVWDSATQGHEIARW